jgi:hypothetical protein
MKEVPFSGEEARKASEAFQKKKDGEGHLSHVRTYRADVQELIAKKQITRTHVAIAEEERRRALGESAVWVEEKQATLIPLYIAGLLLLLGLGVLLYELAGTYFPSINKERAVQEFTVQGEESRTVFLSQFTRQELVNGIRVVARKEKIAQGKIIRMGFVAKTGTTTLPLPRKTFFQSIEGTIPDILSRSLSGDYEGGLVNVGETKGYYIFHTTYYENSVVGLLDWEKNLPYDLYPFVDPLRAEIVTAPEDGSWRAELWKGYDLRVFTTGNGRVGLVYGWINKKTLVIAGNIQAFMQIVSHIPSST